MFPDQPKAPALPTGGVESFEVRGPKGLRPFYTRADAKVYAQTQRDLPNGWTEITRVVRFVEEARAPA